MEVSYYNLSGGINQALTKTELGIDTKKIYWSDSENIEILQNRGIVRQNGNSLFLDMEEKITGLAELEAYNNQKMVITTISGKIYIYDNSTSQTTLVNKTLNGTKPRFECFLNGILVISEGDGLFYIKNNANYDVVDCGLKDLFNNIIYDAIISVYAGRVWVAKDSTIYYSALGKYDDFTTSNDAGYINEFFTDTGSITALKPYKNYLAIYKKDAVYLLTGTNPDDFAIVPFADIGAAGQDSVINIENKQYFLNKGIFALEQVGELNQIQLGSEISLKIKKEFSLFRDLSEAVALHYESKNQVWYFIPYASDSYFHMIWINDYNNKAWFKRIVPQDIVKMGVFNGNIYTADKDGKIYREDFGTTFDGEAIKFMWKSPFLAITSPHHRKLIDEFYFLLDTEYDNNFNLSVYKNYDSEYPDDIEEICSIHQDMLIWAGENISEDLPCFWPNNDSQIPIWPVSRDTLEKAEISESNYSIQLCVTGDSEEKSCAIIGLQFREIYNDE